MTDIKVITKKERKQGGNNLSLLEQLDIMPE